MTSTEPDQDVTPALGAALAEPAGTLTRTERDLVMADLGQLLEALGLGNFARPESPHEVFQMCLRKLAEHENAITWGTSCISCARVLDSAYAETCRAEHAETALGRVRALAEEWIALAEEEDWADNPPAIAAGHAILAALGSGATLPPGKPECFQSCDPDCEVGPAHCEWVHLPSHKPGWHSQTDCPVGKEAGQ